MAHEHRGQEAGHLNEAAGGLADERSLQHDGKADQTNATVEEKIDRVAETLRRCRRR